MRAVAKTKYPEHNIHMAHRLSWQSIESKIRTKKDEDIFQLIEKLTIPQRDFGDPGNGGVAKGNELLYEAVKDVVDKYGLRSKQVAKALNSSPYNLRPGQGALNMKIKGNPDGHFNEELDGNMTPQSKALLPIDTKNSSDFMSMDSFRDFEEQFHELYLLPAIRSINNIK